MQVTREFPITIEPDVVIRLTLEEAKTFVSEGFRNFGPASHPVSYALYHAVQEEL